MAVTATFVCTDVAVIDGVTDSVTLVQNPLDYTCDTSGDGMHPQAEVFRFRVAHSEGLAVGATVTLTTG